MDPSGWLARALSAIKDWPLWLLVAIALALTVFVAVPAFRELASPVSTSAVLFAATAAWIFAVARAAAPIAEAVRNHLKQRATHHFVVTPIDHQCHWGVAKQRDGSFVTQLAINCMVKNRSEGQLYIMNARAIRPKIKGEVLPGLVMTEGQEGNFGTPHIGGNHISGGRTLPVTCTLLIRGVPKQKSGAMHATIEFQDADGHRERFKVVLRQYGSA